MGLSQTAPQSSGIQEGATVQIHLRKMEASHTQPACLILKESFVGCATGRGAGVGRGAGCSDSPFSEPCSCACCKLLSRCCSNIRPEGVGMGTEHCLGGKSERELDSQNGNSGLLNTKLAILWLFEILNPHGAMTTYSAPPIYNAPPTHGTLCTLLLL